MFGACGLAEQVTDGPVGDGDIVWAARVLDAGCERLGIVHVPVLSAIEMSSDKRACGVYEDGVDVFHNFESLLSEKIAVGYSELRAPFISGGGGTSQPESDWWHYFGVLGKLTEMSHEFVGLVEYRA